MIRLSFFPVSYNKINQFFQSHLFLVGTLLFYLLVAYNSSGYHQEDEHYQIIEFANYKLGLIPENRLAWEFAAHIRPGLQPLICFGLLKLFHLLGINDGYDIAFLLRAVTAVFSIFVIRSFVKAHQHLITESLFPYFIFASYLLWFLPYINVRFSSETWSGLFFLMALTHIQHKRSKNNLLKFAVTGVILGISILFRYQSALMVAGMTLWFVFVNKIGFGRFIVFCGSILTILFLGLLVDYWLYGDFVISLYKYFHINLVEGVSSNFGVSPWYEYLKYIIMDSSPFGIFILASFIIRLYFDPKNPMLWAIIPYLIVHSTIPHKELRFLFPIASLVPLFLILSYQDAISFLKRRRINLKFKYLWMITVIMILLFNGTGLYAIATTGAGTCRTVVAEYIHRHYDERRTNIILNGDINPYMDWGPPKNSYYSSTNLHIERVNSFWQTDFLKRKKAGYVNLFVLYDDDITGTRARNLMKHLEMVKVYQNIKKPVKWIYSFYNPSMNGLAISVYEFKK